jgi:hypothetical protein
MRRQRCHLGRRGHRHGARCAFAGCLCSTAPAAKTMPRAGRQRPTCRPVPGGETEMDGADEWPAAFALAVASGACAGEPRGCWKRRCARRLQLARRRCRLSGRIGVGKTIHRDECRVCHDEGGHAQRQRGQDGGLGRRDVGGNGQHACHEHLGHPSRSERVTASPDENIAPHTRAPE